MGVPVLELVLVCLCLCPCLRTHMHMVVEVAGVGAAAGVGESAYLPRVSSYRCMSLLRALLCRAVAPCRCGARTVQHFLGRLLGRK